MNNKVGGDWKEWSQHVLMEIQRLNSEQKNMSMEMKIMSQILAVNTSQLEIHIEGVRLAREQNDILRKDLDAKIELLERAMDDRMTPVEERHIQIKAVMWTITKVGAGLVAIPTLLGLGYKLLEIMKIVGK